MIKRLKEKTRGKKGDVSLLWVLLGFIVILTFQGHVDILNQQSIINDVQQKMDVAGLNALNSTVDIQELQRNEDLFQKKLTNEDFKEHYEHDILQTYRDELYSSIAISGIFTNVEILSNNVEFISAPDEGVLGREHILLDSVVRITMKGFGNFKQNDGEQLMFELGQEGNTKVTSIRQNNEGFVELYLHNQTRLQYQ